MVTAVDAHALGHTPASLPANLWHTSWPFRARSDGIWGTILAPLETTPAPALLLTAPIPAAD